MCIGASDKDSYFGFVFCERFSLILVHLTLKVRVEGSLSERRLEQKVEREWALVKQEREQPPSQNAPTLLSPWIWLRSSGPDLSP